MKKKLFAIILCLAILITTVASFSEVSFAEGENEEAVVLKEEETIDISEEEVPEAVGAPADFDLKSIHTIAKSLENGQVKYYGVRTYSNEFDVLYKVFYSLTEDQYNQVAKDCFMIFKRQDGEAFKIPGAELGNNSITDSQPSGTTAGKIFTEVQFRHHMAYNTLLYSNNNNPTTEPSQENLTWSIELKNDWVIEPRSDFSDNSEPKFAYVYYNAELDGKGHKIYRNDDREKGILQLGSGSYGQDVTVKTATLKNLTIDGSSKYYGIEVSQKGILKLENVKLENCYADKNHNNYGGAIKLNNEAQLTMDANTSISNCKANMGGVIRLLSNCTLNINGSTFTNNQADLGGAICSLNKNNKININDATFDGNKAVKTIDGKYLQGGAIYTNSKLNINGTKNVFKNNTSVNNGGAIISYADTTINGCEFNNNSSTEGNGGAIYQGEGKLTIDENTFTENNAKKSGGAIYALVNSTIKNSKYNENVAKWGGAIFNWDKLNISDVSFDGNIATADGGAIYTGDKEYKNPVGATKYKYPNINKNTVFKNNIALAGFFNPPRNYKDFDGNLKFARNSFTDTLPDQDVAKSLLNNYDINYRNENLSAFFDPNGGEFKDGDNPTDIRVINGEKDKEITLLDAPERNGHKFLGWKCTRNIPEDILGKLPKEMVKKLSKNTIETLKKEGQIYQAGAKFTLDSDYIFIAQWDDPKPMPKPSTKVILTLDENYRGGRITDHELEEGELIAPYLYIPRRRGYIFRGWSYDRKRLDEVKPEDRIYTDTTLYAIWKKAEIEKHEEPEEIRGDDHKAYIFGYPNGTVRPNGNITRAEAAAMLARLLNIEAIGSSAKPNFKDTKSAWYNKAINAVVARGIMKGYPDGRFRPNAPITRAEFTQMISTIDNKPYGTAPFVDVKGHWAERAIGSEYQAKRIAGYPDGLFRPDANITRAEAAVILNKIFERNYDAMSLAKCKNALMLKRFIDLDETFWGYNDMVEATNTHEYVRRYKEDMMKRLEEDWLLIKDINDVK